MIGPFRVIRSDERRDAYAAFATLFGLISSHAVLETARDALFLASIPAERLPFIYVGIAVVTLLVSQLQDKLASTWSRRSAVTAWVAAAAVVTFGFWATLDALGTVGLYALYVWAGLVTTLVLVHFWSLLGDLFTVTQAKRLYSAIGAGSVTGAIAGSALAGLLASSMGARDLLLAASGGFLVTAFLPQMLQDPGAPTTVVDERERGGGMAAGLRILWERPYPRRVAVLVTLSAATLTLADYVFKATVAEAVPAEDLGQFFALVALALNVLSLFGQLGLVGFLLRRFDLSTALAVLPVLLLLGGTSFVVLGTLSAAVALKAVDGSLKHSLHRTTIELLYVPLSQGVRARVKAVVDVAGQRGGQTVASGLILAAAGFGLGPWAVAAMLVVLAVLWAGSALELRRSYLDLFRARIGSGRSAVPSPFDDLDVFASLEVLFQSLDSEEDEVVAAALQVLDRQGKGHLVPRLILLHPSEVVLEGALRMFREAGQRRIIEMAERLLEHPAQRVRVAAVHTLAQAEGGLERLKAVRAAEAEPEVAMAIDVFLAANGHIGADELEPEIEAALVSPDPAVRVALAESLGTSGLRRPDLLNQLANREAMVRRAAAEAMARLRHPDSLPALVRMLALDSTRATALRAIGAYGEAALPVLEAALDDRDLLPAARWSVPDAMADAFPPPTVAPTLLARLPGLRDGMLRRRVVMTLEAMRTEDPELALDASVLDQSIVDSLSRIYRYLDRRLGLARGVGGETPGYRLLRSALLDKESNVQDTLLRLLGLRYPWEDLTEVRLSISSRDEAERSGALELLESTLPPPLRRPVLALFDGTPEADQPREGAAFHAPRDLRYEDVVAEMLASGSPATVAMAAYHVGEVRLSTLRPQVEAIALAHAEEADHDAVRALERLDGTVPPPEMPDHAR